MTKQFICIQCGKEFINTSHKNTRKFCSKSCWATYCNKNIPKKLKPQIIILECIKCGNNFETTRKYMNRRKYCSISCARSKLNILNTKCPCGKNITTKNQDKKYCSLSCRSKYRQREGIYSLQKHKHSCIICNKYFSKYRASKYCSRNCYKEHCKTLEYRIKESLKHTKETVFNGFRQKNRMKEMGRKEYIKWRKAVLARDNYICQKCNAINKLEAHHIKPYATFPELRFEVSNGIIYCEKCHQAIDNIRALFAKGEASYAI